MNNVGENTDLLIELARAGDLEAANRAIARQRERLTKMVRIRMNPRLVSRIDPSDVVQEAMIDAANRISDYLDDAVVEFYPWLRAIAWNKLCDLHRKHLLTKKRSAFREAGQVNDASAEQLVSCLTAGDSEPWVQVSRDELRQQVRSALLSLPNESQEILMLRFVEQMSTREAAQTIGISKSAAKSRQLRALQKLRSALDGGGE